ncbi:MAG: glycosyltransferase family 2 protein [Acidobacteriota bacterium]
MPRVSVIIPTFNREAVLREAIESVLEQTYTDLEVLVVDDGSTDGTRRMVGERFRDAPRVRYLLMENEGQAAARNRGIRESRGELIAFLDSDDLWLPEKLTLQVDRLDRTPGAGMVFCDRIGEAGKDRATTRFQQKGFKGDTSLRGILENGFPFATPSVVVRRKVLEEVGAFDDSFTVAEDWDLWIRVLAHSTATYVDKPLVVVRRRSDSISQSLVLDKWTGWLRLWEKNRDLLLRSGCPRRLLRRWLGHAHKKIAQTLRARGRYAESAEHYLKWWRCQPWQFRGPFWFAVLRLKRPRT